MIFSAIRFALPRKSNALALSPLVRLMLASAMSEFSACQSSCEAFISS